MATLATVNISPQQPSLHATHSLAMLSVKRTPADLLDRATNRQQQQTIPTFQTQHLSTESLDHDIISHPASWLPQNSNCTTR